MLSAEELYQRKLTRIKDSHRIELNSTALLVVDMQHGFLDEGASLQVPKGRAAVPNVASLIEKCRSAKIPVIFTEFVYAASIPCLRGNPFGLEHLPADKDSPVGFGFPSSNCLIGPTEGVGPESAKTVPQLAPRNDELVVQAHTYDKFYGTHLDLALRSCKIDRVMVTGVTTDVCVNSTIVSAATRNYRVIAVTDAMATIHDHIHNACLQIWENKFARLATTEEVLSELSL